MIINYLSGFSIKSIYTYETFNKEGLIDPVAFVMIYHHYCKGQSVQNQVQIIKSTYIYT